MAYTVVAWILVQVAVAVIPVFDAPHWVLKVLLLFIALGFPFVLVLAWAYELTPEGLRRTPDAGEVENRSSRVFDSALIAVLILALVLTTIGERPWASSIPTQHGDDSVATNGPVAEQAVLAVMPFAAVSSDTQAAALAVGFSDSLQNSLSVTHGLATTGMASAIKSSDAEQDHAKIAETLAVDYLVEGSIRVNNGETHVFAQLVEIPGGDAIWSKQFPDSGNGLESVRNEIATRVARKVTGAARVAPEPTGLSAGLFEDWLRLLGQLRRNGTNDLTAARVLAQSLAENAPDFGPAHGALAYLLAAETATSRVVDFNERVTVVNGLLDEAMALAPASARVRFWRAHATSLLTQWRGSETDFGRVNRMFEEALKLWPFSGELHATYAQHKLTWCETDDALHLAQRALELDPLSTLAATVRIDALIRSGKRDLAEAEIDELAELGYGAERLRARLAVARGDLRDALTAYQKIGENEEGMNLEAARVWVTIGEVARAVQLIEAQEQTLDGDIWRLALDHKYDEAYELANSRLSPEHPRSALLIGVLAIEADEHEAAVRTFSRHFQAWIDDAGPLRGPAAIRYAPWFAKALTDVGREAEARRVLDRHLAGLIVVEDRLSAAESGVYFAANYAARGRAADAALALENAIDDGFRLTLGALGDPIDITKSTLLSSLDLDTMHRAIDRAMQ